MSAIIKTDGTARKLDQPQEPATLLTEQDVKDVPKLVRFLTTLARDVTELRRLWKPRRVDFEDWVIVGDGTTKYRFPHGFGGRVRWSVVDWQGVGAEALVKDSETDSNTLVLRSYEAGTLTLRVEEAG